MAWTHNGPCEKCGSSDGRGHYEDGSGYCFACETHFAADGNETETVSGDWLRGAYLPMKSRGLDEETLRKAGYAYDRAAKLHIMNVRDSNGKLIGQKTRTQDKEFSWRGDAKKDPPIYLSWLWPSTGRSVTLCEGEIDCLSYWQAWGLKYPVGSLPNGTGSVKKAILKHYEQLCAFQNIYLSFDADEPGQKALELACQLLPVGKVKIIRLPEDCKDANECLMKHGPQALVRAYYDATDYRPDGILAGTTITRDRLKAHRKKGYDLPWPVVNQRLMGIRKGEITMLTAGSGVGKSALARSVAYHLQQQHGLKIGSVYLEENVETTAAAYVGLHLGVPLKALLANPDMLTDDQWDTAIAAAVAPGMYFDHFGSLASDRLIMMLRFMAAAGCDFIVLDHVSIVVSGMETMDERRDLDVLLTKLRSFVQETGVGVIAVAHLKRKPGTPFNEGGQVSLSDLRGSAALEQLSDTVIALERNQQDEANKHLSTIRVLKCRITGDTGEADTLKWNTRKGCFENGGPFEPTYEEEEEAHSPF
jgi:twinkle protein